MTHPTSRWLGAGIVILLFALLILAINPIHEFPVEDDWDYAKEVLNVLQTGSFHRLEVTQATVFFPALWGALFAKLFGFSFTTLRVSTLVLALGALLVFYALLGEMGFSVPRRVLGTLALMLAPAFVYLAFSFMTDIFLLFGILSALYFYTRAWRSQRLGLVFVASMFATLGFLARQVGFLIPISFGFFIWLQRHQLAKTSPRAWLLWLLVGGVVPVLVLTTYLAWSRFGGGANWADSARTLTGTVSFWFQFDTPGVLVRRFAIASSTLAIYILPLWLASLGGILYLRQGWSASARWQKIGIALVAILSVIALVRAATRNEWFPYLTDISTRAGFRPYLAFFAEGAGVHRPLILSADVSALLTVLAGLFGILLSGLIIGRLRAHRTPPLTFVYLATGILALASLTFFTYFERYLLPLVPGMILVVLDATRRVRWSVPAAALGVLLIGLVSVTFMRDYFSWNAARWEAGRALVAAGVPIAKIDGGYEWNGWQLYDASVVYIRAHNLEMTIDPWKYILDPEYMLTFQPMPNYQVVQKVPFSTPLRAGGMDLLYVLRRN